MMECGHKESFRDMVTVRAVARYTMSLRNHKNGSKVMYRTRAEMLAQRKAGGGKATAADWFRKSGASSVFNVPATADSHLATEVQEVLDTVPGPRGMQAKVMEHPGRSVKQTLVKSNPFPRVTCGRDLCPWVRRGESCKERCYREGVGYVARCKECRRKQVEEEEKEESQVEDQVYIGESSRCIVTRMGYHLNDYDQTMVKVTGVKNARKRKDQPLTPSEGRGSQVMEQVEGGGEGSKVSSWMTDHTVNVHNSKEVDFDFYVTGTFTKPLYRQVDESDRIQVAEGKGEVDIGKVRWKVGTELLNRKHEYYAPRTMQYNFENSGRSHGR